MNFFTINWIDMVTGMSHKYAPWRCLVYNICKSVQEQVTDRCRRVCFNLILGVNTVTLIPTYNIVGLWQLKYEIKNGYFIYTTNL